ncbi:unnamed protein product [Porites evermanni]|uniref:Uncharacterized protein n=1 Tax=Porites evermanni TaxID=104178 RepID=A0ABN8MRZ5_9CNID|nr:unnamed protein product [Porites evermanni]
MAGKLKVSGESQRYINMEAMEGLLDGQSRHSSLTRKRLQVISSISVRTLICIVYFPFLAWLIIGMVLYSVHAYETTFIANHTILESTERKAFRHADQMILLWMVSQIINVGLVTLGLSKIPSFLGYLAILKLLVRLPSFWSLLSLYGISLLRYLLLMWLKYDSGKEMALILASIIWEGAQIVFIGFLNFTQLALHIDQIDESDGVSSELLSLIVSAALSGFWALTELHFYLPAILLARVTSLSLSSSRLSSLY